MKELKYGLGVSLGVQSILYIVCYFVDFYFDYVMDGIFTISFLIILALFIIYGFIPIAILFWFGLSKSFIEKHNLNKKLFIAYLIIFWYLLIAISSFVSIHFFDEELGNLISQKIYFVLPMIIYVIDLFSRFFKFIFKKN